MPHFFINSNDISSNIIIISKKETYNHLAFSMRIKINETVEFIDEKLTVYESKIIEITKQYIKAQIINTYKSNRFLDYDISLATGVLNSDSQNDIIKKATQLGVNTIYPVLSDNSAFKHSLYQKKSEKWIKIAIEASKQCQRAFIPKIKIGYSFSELLLENFDYIIVFSEKENNYTLKNYLSNIKIEKNKKILLIIGPEGGFSQREFSLFDKFNIPQVSLGKLILQADTACIVAISNLIYDLN